MRPLYLAPLLFAGCTAVLGIDDVKPVTDDSSAQLAGDETPHAFGDVVTGQTSASFTISITNRGTAPTGALATALTGDGFAITNDGCGGVVLAPTEVCTIDVTFQPHAAGPASGEVAVTASPGGAVHVPLSGTAYAPGDLAFDSTTYDFMTVDAGQASAGVSFTLTNTGGSPTGALATTIGGDTAQFTVIADGCKGQTLAPSASCVIKVGFAPTTYGPFTLSVLATATPGGAASISLGGTGRTHYALTVTSTGDGSGTIAAAGLTCTGATCTGSYARTGVAPSVQITATPATGVTLSWSGDCAGASNDCTVVMDAARSATATFSLVKNPLTVATRFVGAGTGKVTSSPSGIDCGTTCTHTYAATTMVTLTATPSGTSVFQGWTGDCSGSTRTCTISMAAARTVTAIFKPPFNYIFATSTTYPMSAIGGLGGADDICQSHAAAAGLPGTFVAFLSTSTVDAKTRLGGARGWIRTDGKPVLDSLATTLVSGQVFYSPELDENGAVQGFAAITGSQPDGTAAIGSTCSDYTSNAGYAAVGAPTDGAFNWIEQGVSDCGGSYALVCMQTDYANPVGVPPLASPIAFVTKGYFDTATGLAQADALCQSEASSAGLQYPTSYKALLGTHTMAAASRFDASYTFMRTDSVPLNAIGDSFFDKSKRWIVPLDVAADHSYFAGADIAIGSLDPTVIGSDTCNDWSVDTGAAKMGKIQSYSSTPWKYAYAMDCTKYAKLICMYSNQ